MAANRPLALVNERVGRRVSSVPPLGDSPVGAVALTVDPSGLAKVAVSVTPLGVSRVSGLFEQLTARAARATATSPPWSIVLFIKHVLLIELEAREADKRSARAPAWNARHDISSAKGAKQKQPDPVTFLLETMSLSGRFAGTGNVTMLGSAAVSRRTRARPRQPQSRGLPLQEKHRRWSEKC